ncbi:MAG: hypothetical protein HYY23_05505 [Verrucomicrobia bacterium]|nr:hypothetical protein [Verrucomicrobiota bacterium]
MGAKDNTTNATAKLAVLKRIELGIDVVVMANDLGLKSNGSSSEHRLTLRRN